MKLNSSVLTALVREKLSFLEDYGFKYYKSYKQFRKKFNQGFSYITIDITTKTGLYYSLAFYIGVRIDDVEILIKEIKDDSKKLTHYDRTISVYTLNIGPKSKHWKYKNKGYWYFNSMLFINLRLRQVKKFINNIAIPYLEYHSTIDKIRDTLINNPGKSNHLFPYQKIFVIDLLQNNKDALISDYKLLKERYSNYPKDYQKDFENFYFKVLKKFE